MLIAVALGYFSDGKFFSGSFRGAPAPEGASYGSPAPSSGDFFAPPPDAGPSVPQPPSSPPPGPGSLPPDVSNCDGLPDLYIADVKITRKGFLALKPYNTLVYYNVSFVIGNKGGKVDKDVEMALIQFDKPPVNPNGKKLATATLSKFSAPNCNELKEVGLNQPSLSNVKQLYLASATVDPKNIIQESNENNNTFDYPTSPDYSYPSYGNPPWNFEEKYTPPLPVPFYVRTELALGLGGAPGVPSGYQFTWNVDSFAKGYTYHVKQYSFAAKLANIPIGGGYTTPFNTLSPANKSVLMKAKIAYSEQSTSDQKLMYMYHFPTGQFDYTYVEVLNEKGVLVERSNVIATNYPAKPFVSVEQNESFGGGVVVRGQKQAKIASFIVSNFNPANSATLKSVTVKLDTEQSSDYSNVDAVNGIINILLKLDGKPIAASVPAGSGDDIVIPVSSNGIVPADTKMVLDVYADVTTGFQAKWLNTAIGKIVYNEFSEAAVQSPPYAHGGHLFMITAGAFLYSSQAPLPVVPEGAQDSPFYWFLLHTDWEPYKLESISFSIGSNDAWMYQHLYDFKLFVVLNGQEQQIGVSPPISMDGKNTVEFKNLNFLVSAPYIGDAQGTKFIVKVSATNEVTITGFSPTSFDHVGSISGMKFSWEHGAIP